MGGVQAFLRREGLPLTASLPGMLVLLVLFAYPVLRLFALSFEAGTFEAYHEIASDDFYAFILYLTFRIGFWVTLASVLLGYPLAYVMATASRAWSMLILLCVLLPFWTSMLVRTYAWMVILGRDGIVNGVLTWLGVIEQPLALLHNETAVIIGMVHVLMPFFVFPVYAVMRRVDPAVLQAAEGLGAGWWSAFWRIYLPLTLPGVVAGCSLVFILSIGFFIAPALLGGGRVLMMAVLIEQEVRQFLNWELAGALSLLLLLATLAVHVGLKRVAREPAAKTGGEGR